MRVLSVRIGFQHRFSPIVTPGSKDAAPAKAPGSTPGIGPIRKQHRNISGFGQCPICENITKKREYNPQSTANTSSSDVQNLPKQDIFQPLYHVKYHSPRR
jgi:hypothetical protein